MLTPLILALSIAPEPVPAPVRAPAPARALLEVRLIESAPLSAGPEAVPGDTVPVMGAQGVGEIRSLPDLDTTALDRELLRGETEGGEIVLPGIGTLRDVRLVAAPRIVALEGEEASVESGSRGEGARHSIRIR